MDIEIIGNKESADDIIYLTSQWDKSVAKCDSNLLAKDYIKNVEVFDIGTQLVGSDKYKELWSSCFPYFGESPKVSRRKVKLYAGNDLAFMHFYSKVTGSNITNPDEQPWCRTTVCFQKTNGAWSVVHEHISMPIDFEKGVQALIIGEP
ncbi:nuclear transport factor 2 family protein [Dasania marina]|uniref:YybH family protein n=1 Tax=Dasania marina TaxID=471499 RepID=UPI0030DBD127|tara:strand:- start:99686 stop:100132 length:447 start_codon:yes stop_codon:yes gene_type:complete